MQGAYIEAEKKYLIWLDLNHLYSFQRQDQNTSIGKFAYKDKDGAIKKMDFHMTVDYSAKAKSSITIAKEKNKKICSLTFSGTDVAKWFLKKLPLEVALGPKWKFEGKEVSIKIGQMPEEAENQRKKILELLTQAK
jgi:hypothetical protein